MRLNLGAVVYAAVYPNRGQVFDPQQEQDQKKTPQIPLYFKRAALISAYSAAILETEPATVLYRVQVLASVR